MYFYIHHNLEKQSVPFQSDQGTHLLLDFIGFAEGQVMEQEIPRKEPTGIL